MSYESQTQQATEERSLGALLGDLMRETTTLMRQEIDLAKSEMIEKATVAGKNVGAIAVGGAVAYLGLLAILAAIVLLLIHLGMAPWLSALVVGVIVAAIGGVLISHSINALKEIDPAPKRTIETLKEDVQWAKDQTR